MGGNAVAEAEALLNASGVPTFDHPDAAARAFCLMAQYSSNLRALYETPVLLTGSQEEIRRERVETVLREVREAGRTLLTEAEAKFELRYSGSRDSTPQERRGSCRSCRISTIARRSQSPLQGLKRQRSC